MIILQKLKDWSNLMHFKMTGKTFIILVISLLLVSGKGIANNDQPYAGKNILALFSLQPTTPAYRIILEGIHAELTKEFGDNYTLQPEYLGMDQYPNESFSREQFEPYNEKFRDVKIDLLICIGVNLAGTLKKYAEPYLLNLPAVSLDYDLSDYGFPWEISLNDKTVVIPLKFEIDKTITTMLSIFPRTSSINIISGVSTHDQFFFSISRQEAVKVDSSIKVDFFTNMAMAEILKMVGQMPDNSIIIVPRFSLDSKQVNYYNFEAIRLICRAANVPVFTYSSIGFGDGAVGGYIMNFEKVAMIVGEAAVRVLNGENPRSIKYDGNDYYEYMFDFRELNKWGLLGSKRLPKGSSIYFEEITFFDKYRWIFIGGVLFLLFQTLLIVRLIFLNRKQQLLTQQIRENETKYRELIREDRILRIGQLTASL